ncbi:metallophosphoesterase family protein [Mesorhizobium sp. B4-1-4]|uniref:metallophosphoesterase family protein n=1 Tax=Mesorhizobium sp. B4-1-4 TaxID=2589888 RepID=UPI001129673D|nr:metallophosphoesterase [Mesorhizobium sp. B4-1-4]UCI31748.1 metallophosphoesterase [Mesorhizobium sp. B4-1-4]
MPGLRIALVADIHAGETRSNIESAKAFPLLTDVVQQANNAGVDLFVTLGDNVNATNREEDFRHLCAVREILDRVRAPVVPLFGNNELKFLGAERAAEALGCKATSEVLSLREWTLIFWRPTCELSLSNGLLLSDEDFSWLRDAVKEATYPSVLFLHAPIDGNAMVGNYYFSERPDLASYRNAAEARSIIEGSGKVVLVLGGHVHWHSTSTIDGIHHKTIPSLTDTFKADDSASEAWAILELSRERISLDVFGREPMSWAAAPRLAGTRWYRPLTKTEFEARMGGLWSQGPTS